MRMRLAKQMGFGGSYEASKMLSCLHTQLSLMNYFNVFNFVFTCNTTVEMQLASKSCINLLRTMEAAAL